MQLFAFEGPDGAGKTTVTSHVAQELMNRGYAVEIIKFPVKGTTMGDRCYEITNLAGSDNPYARALNFILDRNDAMEDIRRAQDLGKIVLFDRYFPSTIAYETALMNHAMDPDEEEYFDVFQFMDWLMDIEMDRLMHPVPHFFFCTLSAGTSMDTFGEKNSESAYDSMLTLQRRIADVYDLMMDEFDGMGIGYSEVYMDIKGERNPLDDLVKEIASEIENIHNTGDE